VTEPRAFINAVAGIVPEHDVHHLFIDWAQGQVEDPRLRKLFMRMAERSGIEHRWSVLPPAPGGRPHNEEGGFYHPAMPPTSSRMQRYAEEAPELALRAIERLREQVPLDGITHLVVASCTGFVAPGIDQIIARRLGLDNVERTLVGFMGCYAAVCALRTAHHIARSQPGARVLAVTIELCTLHLQDTQALEQLLAMLQFSDGAAAALITSEPGGFEMSHLFSMALEDSAELIQWKIGDTGFEMTLSGEVPARIQHALERDEVRATLYNGWGADEIDSCGPCRRSLDPRRCREGAGAAAGRPVRLARRPLKLRQHVLLDADVRPLRADRPARRRQGRRARLRPGPRRRRLPLRAGLLSPESMTCADRPR
jgi:alpha-pyrone synthase